jgi:hypothetical protein
MPWYKNVLFRTLVIAEEGLKNVIDKKLIKNYYTEKLGI